MTRTHIDEFELVAAEHQADELASRLEEYWSGSGPQAARLAETVHRLVDFIRANCNVEQPQPFRPLLRRVSRPSQQAKKKGAAVC